jgi:hypothetical protein
VRDRLRVEARRGLTEFSKERRRNVNGKEERKGPK